MWSTSREEPKVDAPHLAAFRSPTTECKPHSELGGFVVPRVAWLRRASTGRRSISMRTTNTVKSRLRMDWRMVFMITAQPTPAIATGSSLGMLHRSCRGLVCLRVKWTAKQGVKFRLKWVTGARRLWRVTLGAIDESRKPRTSSATGQSAINHTKGVQTAAISNRGHKKKKPGAGGSDCGGFVAAMVRRPISLEGQAPTLVSGSTPERVLRCDSVPALAYDSPGVCRNGTGSLARAFERTMATTLSRVPLY